MLNKSEPAELTTEQPGQTPPSTKVAASPVSIICDLTVGNAFCENYQRPHVPVLAAFGGDPLHVCRSSGEWDLDRAVLENADSLARSIHKIDPDEKSQKWDDLTFQFGPRSFLYADMNRIVAFASSHMEAERLVTWFSKAYSKPSAPSGGSFYLITSGREISIEAVALGAETLLGDEGFGLHYGNETREWHQDFTGKVRASNHGLSIFEGTPGTGKTSYLRHLMGVLKESHRFYFIPPAVMGILSSPDFIGFWANQRRQHAERKFVVILEDSESALMSRGTDNREQVSAILNLSDGMLADFLRLQIICTINCRADDIDQALLRPGRLLCHRVFRRLDYAQASRLAESLGRKLPIARDYSLAEVFAGIGVEQISRPRIGFAA